MIKIIIADDQHLIREGIKYIIEQDEDICVVGVASNGYEAFKLCEEHVPDLVLMDIMMPACNGIESTKLIKEKYESIKIIVLTTFHDSTNIKKAIRNGADGYILKDIKPSDLISTIKATINGLRIIHQSVFNSFIRNNTAEDSKKVNNKPAIDQSLTEREIEITRMVVFGKTNKEIASNLYLSEGRVKNIITEILKKLSLNDRTQLAIYAVKNHLV